MLEALSLQSVKTRNPNLVVKQTIKSPAKIFSCLSVHDSSMGESGPKDRAIARSRSDLVSTRDINFEQTASKSALGFVVPSAEQSIKLISLCRSSPDIILTKDSSSVDIGPSKFKRSTGTRVGSEPALPS